MAILPLQLARVSNALRMNLAQRNLTRTQRSLLEVQNQLVTGKRLTTPSDSPADASIAQQLRKTLEQRAAYADNLKQAGSHLSEVDSTMADLTDMLRQAQSIASANVGSDVTPDQRKAAATIVTSLYNQVLSLANRQFRNTYLFSGDSNRQPFTSDATGVRFTGSDRPLENQVDESATLAFMANGNDVFGALSTRIHGTGDLTPALTLDTRITDLRGTSGQGVNLGTIVLSNGSTSRSIDLSGADTIGDILDAINAAAVGGITATLNPDASGIRLDATGADDISVSELGGTTAADLGIITTSVGAGASFLGATLDPNVTLLSRLDTLRRWAGIDTSGLVITNGQRTATVDLSTATTVQDMLNLINTSGTGVLARISDNGTGIDILNPVQGAEMMIAENGGFTAQSLGVRSFSPDSPLSELNGGTGLRTVAGDDIQITRRDGSIFSVDLTSLNTIQDVIDAINAADGGGGVNASFTTVGNGIVLTDSTGGAVATLAVRPVNFSLADRDLGLDVASTGNSLIGRDVNSVSAFGIFGNLGMLRDALTTSDQTKITKAAEALQQDLDRVIRIRGQVGARSAEIESRQDRLDEQNLATQALLSNLEDADFNEAITRFQALQTTLQANLQTTGQVLNLSLLDFLG